LEKSRVPAVSRLRGIDCSSTYSTATVNNTAHCIRLCSPPRDLRHGSGLVCQQTSQAKRAHGLRSRRSSSPVPIVDHAPPPVSCPCQFPIPSFCTLVPLYSLHAVAHVSYRQPEHNHPVLLCSVRLCSTIYIRYPCSLACNHAFLPESVNSKQLAETRHAILVRPCIAAYLSVAAAYIGNNDGGSVGSQLPRFKTPHLRFGLPATSHPVSSYCGMTKRKQKAHHFQPTPSPALT
jgi:hypothetical protein